MARHRDTLRPRVRRLAASLTFEQIAHVCYLHGQHRYTDRTLMTMRAELVAEGKAPTPAAMVERAIHASGKTKGLPAIAFAAGGWLLLDWLILDVHDILRAAKMVTKLPKRQR